MKIFIKTQKRDNQCNERMKMFIKHGTINAMNKNVDQEAIASNGAGNLLPQCSLQCVVRSSSIPLSLDLLLLFFCGMRNSCIPFYLDLFLLFFLWCECGDLFHPPFLGLVFTFLLWSEELFHIPLSFFCQHRMAF